MPLVNWDCKRQTLKSDLKAGLQPGQIDPALKNARDSLSLNLDQDGAQRERRIQSGLVKDGLMKVRLVKVSPVSPAL